MLHLLIAVTFSWSILGRLKPPSCQSLKIRFVPSQQERAQSQSLPKAESKAESNRQVTFTFRK